MTTLILLDIAFEPVAYRTSLKLAALPNQSSAIRMTVIGHLWKQHSRFSLAPDLILVVVGTLSISHKEGHDLSTCQRCIFGICCQC
jgi:hypothetical protein